MPAYTTCNVPKVKDPVQLNRLLKSRWCPDVNTEFEITNSSFSIYGCGWPKLYRLPTLLTPGTYYPGACGKEPVDIDNMLGDIGPFLCDRLVVEVRDDKQVMARWVVEAGSTYVRKVLLSKDTKLHTVFWATKRNDFKIKTETGKVVRIAGVLVHVRQDGNVLIRLDDTNGNKAASSSISKVEALKLGLALVQAASGSIDVVNLKNMYEEHSFFLNQESENDNEECTGLESGRDNPERGTTNSDSQQQGHGTGSLVYTGDSELE